MRALIIRTPIAGGGQGEARFAAVQHGLAAEVAVAESIGQAESLAAAAAGYDVVCAAGGDGTVHDVVNGLMALPEPRPRLAILPLGTGNDIARNLGILTVDDSLAALQADTVRPLDLLQVALHRDAQPATLYAVLNCGIGLGAMVIRKTTTTVKRLFGTDRAYLVGTLRALAGWHSPALTVVHDQGTFTGRVLFLAVGNGEWEGGGAMRLSPGAKMDDGLLNVLLIRHGPKLEVLRNFARITDGTHVDHRLVEYFTTTRLEVTGDEVLGVQTDGDVVGETPVSVTVVPGALTVVAPPEG